ncbi:MAG TPA: DUF1992 domain-containing protein [Pyrinomonadaceae bacterium]|nr:DUF1992 domain-containing protein [Pyrinomonadaceae bacterium]
MRFDRIVEEKIREAVEAGEFDRLEGAGRPVNLESYFAAPEDLRAGYSVLKNAGVVPEEAQLLKEIDEARRELEQSPAAARRAELGRRLRELRLKLDLLVERNRTRR